jgi:hypothetical protein
VHITEDKDEKVNAYQPAIRKGRHNHVKMQIIKRSIHQCLRQCVQIFKFYTLIHLIFLFTLIMMPNNDFQELRLICDMVSRRLLHCSILTLSIIYHETSKIHLSGYNMIIGDAITLLLLGNTSAKFKNYFDF